MRRTILKGIHELAKRDPRVVFIGSDISRRDLGAFVEELPERCIMEGVYEGHIVGMAAGLALSGKVPYINTIATFLTRRCFEQVVIDLCLHRLPVRLIGSGGGAVYAPLGGTHLAIEDLSILSALPHLTIVAPSDAEEMARFVPTSVDWPGPIYIRLAKGGDPIVPWPAGKAFELGKAYALRDGRDALLVGTGVTTHRSLAAADLLAKQGVEAGVLHVPTVKPLDAPTLLREAEGKRVVVVAEEGLVHGGLGGAVAETLAEVGGPRVLRLGFPDTFVEHFGSQDEILARYGLTPEGIAGKVRAALEKKPAWPTST